MDLQKRIINGSEISYPLFHITEKDRIDSIMKSGLLTGEELEEIGYERLFPYSGPSYIYFFNPISLSKALQRTTSDWLSSKTILECKTPEDYPLEREYEQATITLKLDDENLTHFLKDRSEHSSVELKRAEDFVKYYFEKAFNIDYSGPFTVEEVKRFIDDEISDEEWDKKDGKYRGGESVSPDNLNIVEDLESLQDTLKQEVKDIW